MIEDETLGQRIRVRLTSDQHSRLCTFLLPGDGLEAVAILVCGRAGTRKDELLLVHQIIEVPYDHCIERSVGRVTWPTDVLNPILPMLSEREYGLIKIHSHPGGYSEFSDWDDSSDRELFPGLYSWSGSDRPHLSAILLPDGTIKARVVNDDGSFGNEAAVTAVGTHLRMWPDAGTKDLADSVARTAQAFGNATVQHLQKLTIGVVGCSGTGGWVIELLARLGVGQLVLVDPDHVEAVNLNRIIHSTFDDARAHRSKVAVLGDAIRRTGLPVAIETHQADVHTAAMVRRLSRCDVIIGCVDSIDAREILSRMSTYYVLPYFDVGVKLVADGVGGISHIVGSSNYVHPHSPSLMERGLYSSKQLADSGLRRSDPVAYSDQVDAGYIAGASVASPAVASVNAFYASLLVNDLLERIHPYRDELAPLGVTISLSQLRIIESDHTDRIPSLLPRTGRGDAKPLLGLPALSEPS